MIKSNKNESDLLEMKGKKKRTLDFEVGGSGCGVDDGDEFTRGGFLPLAICIVLVHIPIYDLCKSFTSGHSFFASKLILVSFVGFVL